MSPMERKAEAIAFWLRPVFIGANLLFDIVRWKMLFGFPVLLILLWQEKLNALGAIAWALVVATVAGAGGGAAFSVCQPLRRRAPRTWAIVAGYASAAAYLAVVMVGFSAVMPEFRLSEAAGRLVWVVVTVPFGLLMAGVYHDLNPDRPRRKGPSRFERLLQRWEHRLSVLQVVFPLVAISIMLMIAFSWAFRLVFASVLMLVVSVEALRRSLDGAATGMRPPNPRLKPPGARRRRLPE